MADKHFFQKMLTAAAGDTRAGTNFCVMIYDDMGADQSKGEAHAKHYCIGERQRFIFTENRFCIYIVDTKSLLAYSRKVPVNH